MKLSGIAIFITIFTFSFLTAEPEKYDNSRPVSGFADLHIHQMAEYGYGGGWLYGKHNGPISEALACCSGLNDHGFLAGEGILGIHLSRKNGFSKFDGWPMWDAISHQQVHEDWLRKAHRDGLNIMIMSAVNFAPLAKLIPKRHRIDAWGTEDIPAIERQVEATYKFTEKHDWCEIALDPFQARRIIHEGKLAIVLGFETSDPFADKDLDEQLDKFYDMGIRSIQLSHQLNNRFGGVAPHNKIFYIFQFIRNIVEEKDKARSELYKELQKHYNVRSRDALPQEVKEAAEEFWERSFGFEFDENGKNVQGLTEEGEVILKKMMKKNMLIDVAHMSERSLVRSYEIAKENSYYPLYMSHGHVRDTMIPKKAKEEKTTPGELMYTIMETGGMFGLRVGTEETLTYKKSGVENCCPGTNRSFAQMYQYAVKETQIKCGTR